jgi:catechol 2,3-dioxygenase
MAVTRLAYLSIRVMDLDEAERHYTDVIGLRVTARQPGQVYLQAHEAQDHHCVILNAADRAGLDHIGFKVSEPDDLAEAEAAAREWGLTTSRCPEGEVLGQSDGVKIALPSGHVLNLFHHSEHVGYSYGMRDPDPILDRVDGVSPVTHLDHTLVGGPDAERSVRFLQEALDFNISEVIAGPDGQPFLFFATVGNTMHNLAIGPGPAGALHHMAFFVPDRADVIRRVDLLKHRNVATFKYGLSRHGVAGVTTVYFHDPSGNRNEFQCGVYETPGVPERVARITWDAANIPRGVFYYESEIYEEFFTVVT